jgi:hypothetical protein
MSHTLILDAAMRGEVARVMEYACAHPSDFASLLARANGREVHADPSSALAATFAGEHAADSSGCTMNVHGFQISFVVEEQRPPAGWRRHLSISVGMPGKPPHPVAVAAIMALFGFRRGFDQDYVWFESRIGAINILEPLGDDEVHDSLHLAQPWLEKRP